jgi:hypothetical protein
VTDWWFSPCPGVLDTSCCSVIKFISEKTTNLSQATNKLNNRATRCVRYTWTGRKPTICHKPGVLDTSCCSVIKFISGLWQIGGFLPVQVYWTHLVALLLSLLVAFDRLVVFSRSRCTANLSQATNKLNNRATRCVQYTWTARKPPICHKPLINLITEQQDVSSTSGPGENHKSVTSH